MIFLSIVVPLFNRREELKRLLDSLDRQTKKNFEVIIIDDGSSVNYDDLLSFYKTKIDLKYQKIENTGGPAKPRNLGIKLAKYDWISFLDSDDWWHANRVETIVNVMKINKADLYYHKLKIIADNRFRRWWSKSVVGSKMKSNAIHHLLVIDNPIPNSSVILNKQCFSKYGEIDECIPCVEDYEYWIRLAKNKCKFHFIDKTLGVYWMSNAGISSNLLLSANSTAQVIEKYRDNLSNNMNHFIDSRIHYIYGSIEYVLGNFESAKKHLYLAKNLATLELRLKRIFKILIINLGLK